MLEANKVFFVVVYFKLMLKKFIYYSRKYYKFDNISYTLIFVLQSFKQNQYRRFRSICSA